MALTSRRRGALAALVTLLGLAGSAVPASATQAFELERVAGADRYATASALAANAFPTATDAVIARGDGTAQQFADALAGSYLAGAEDAPLLLTRRDTLPSSTAARLQALGVQTVHLLGGTAAVSTAVEQQLDATFDVVRVQGSDRYATAAEIATSQPATGIGTVGGKRTVFLATGLDAADALAAGPASFAKRLPILLTQPNTLPQATLAALDELDITHVVILGGTAAVSNVVQATVIATGATAQRVAGINRYATATELADFAATSLAPWSNTAVDLANGLNPADALAGGPAAGNVNRSILLTAPTTLPSQTADWLAESSSTLTSGRIFGGTAAVSDAVVTAAETAGKGTATSGTVVSVDAANDRYRYVAQGATTATTVTYATGDTFSVDGQAATLGGFEASLSPADLVTVSGTTPKTHALTNQAPPTSGTIGNVDTSDDQYEIVHPVTGDTLNGGRTYGEANAFFVDGASRTQAQFEADLNEGDTVAVSGAEVRLTNVDVTGTANTITKPATPFQSTTQFKIGGLGDVATAGSGETGETDGNDDRFAANGGIGATDVFVVDGVTDRTWDQFNDALSQGDTVTYRRVGGIETFTLVNSAPAPLSGQAVDDLAASGGLGDDANDGGSFTLATASGPTAVTYAAGGTWVVNGAVATEADFEAAYSAGDAVSYRAADAGSGTAQRLELTDADLRGAVAQVNTGDTPTPPPGSRPANSYAVVAGDGSTVLATVVYDADDAYLLNGNAVNQTTFEAELDAIAAGTRSGTVQVVVAGTVQQHRLTTAAAG